MPIPHTVQRLCLVTSWRQPLMGQRSTVVGARKVMAAPSPAVLATRRGALYETQNCPFPLFECNPLALVICSGTRHKLKTGKRAQQSSRPCLQIWRMTGLACGHRRSIHLHPGYVYAHATFPLAEEA